MTDHRPRLVDRSHNQFDTPPWWEPKPKYEVVVPGREYFGIAGVWAPWKNPRTDQWENTFSTFTSAPNALIEKIHIRQAVILSPSEYEEWLAPSERPPVHLLRVLQAESMTMTLLNVPVSKTKEALMGGLFD